MDLPRSLHEPFAAAMSQSVLLPAFAALFGLVAALFLVGTVPRRSSGPVSRTTPVGRTAPPD